MMDDETRWQDAALPADLPADGQLVGPTRPDAGQDEATDYDDLETGIASIFAALQAAGGDATTGETADGADDEPSFEDEHTFALLGELDRLWQRPSP